MTPLESGPRNPSEHENDIIHLENEMSKGLSQTIRHYRLPGHPGSKCSQGFGWACMWVRSSGHI